MGGLRDFLQLFRPAGIPGGAAGVPAARAAARAAELEPVWMSLADTEARATRIRRDALDHAEASRRQAARDAALIIADARALAQATQAEATARARQDAEVATAEVDARTDAEIRQMSARAARRMPTYIDRVVSAARALMDEPARRS